MANVEVNKPAPDFTLLDFNGVAFQLSSFKGSKNVLLVLNRGFA
jgi:peroxiredoxin